MSIKEEFEKALKEESGNSRRVWLASHEIKDIALWGAKWALTKAEDACMSPTSLLKELDGNESV